MAKEYMDGSKDITSIQYNENNDPVLKTVVDSYGDIEQVEEYTYEGKNLINYKKKDGSSNLLTESTFTYTDDKISSEKRTDENGNEHIIQYDFSHGGEIPDMIVKNKQEKIIEAFKHTFDEQKRLKEEISESSRDGYKKNRVVYEYDDLNNISEVKYYDQNQRMFKKQVNVYDDRNLLVEEVMHEERPEVGLYTNQSTFFEYDLFKD
jgi:hypothetical protein